MIGASAGKNRPCTHHTNEHTINNEANTQINLCGDADGDEVAQHLAACADALVHGLRDQRVHRALRINNNGRELRTGKGNRRSELTTGQTGSEMVTAESKKLSADPTTT